MLFVENLRRLGEYLPHVPLHVTCERGQYSVEVSQDQLIPLITLLKGQEGFVFTQLLDICGVDYWAAPQDPGHEGRFRVVYHLLSLVHNQRIRVKVPLKEGDVIPSLTPVFACANWYEREVFDMFGIMFKDHPSLSRILLEDSFEGFPLRKDFPLSGHVQVRYDAEGGQVITEPLKLEQPLRTFDTLSPWSGYPVPSAQSTLSENP